jgi:hypothetical protein
MYFTLAVSAATAQLCAALADRARIADPGVMPVPGPAAVAWRSADGRAALVRWGGAPGAERMPGTSLSLAIAEDVAEDLAMADDPVASHAGTIWIGSPTPGSGRTPVYARTSVTRVDPVYVAEVPGAVIVSDRAMWAAWTANRLDAHDPMHVCAVLNPGFPLGSVTPFSGVSALPPSTTLHLLHGELTRIPTPVGGMAGGFGHQAGSSASRSARPSVRLSAPVSVPAGSAVAGAAEDAGIAHTGLAGLGLAPTDSEDEDHLATTPAPPPTTATAAGERPRAAAGAPATDELTLTAAASGRAAAPGDDPDEQADGNGARAARVPSPLAPAGRRLVGAGPGGAREVAEALVAAVAPLRAVGRPVELSLTGGKDSRLVAAALVAAGVAVEARTHGFADHPDVVVAAEIARRLGIEHIVRTPAAPGQHTDVLGRIRSAVLVADGMLSAFENVGRPDPTRSPVITAGGHGGELLRGGYAETAGGGGAAAGLRAALAPARRAARSAELLRRLTTKHLGLLRRGPAAGYVASLAPWTGALARSPLPALDDFYLVNRAGRWSAAARQAYLIREYLAQPLFDDRVVLAARQVPLADRISGTLIEGVLTELCPALVDIPLAGKPPVPKAQPPTGAAMGAAHASFDWRRQYGSAIATFMRDYILDQGAAGGLFEVVQRSAAEKLLTPPHEDRVSVWALATMACLLSGDFRNAREATPQLPVD